MQLQNKVSIITGAGSGIGQASAIHFAREGAKVVIADIDQLNGQKTAEQILDQGGMAEFIQVNVSQPEQVRNLVDYVMQQYSRIDVLFNNAGMEVFTSISETT